VWYPAVGLVIGLILWLVGAVLVATTSLFLAATLVLVVWVAITGALHLDGVADCADAWVGGLGDRQKVLRILKDPRCGSMAVVSLILLLLTKLAALQLLLAAPRW
jgi:adenosylcobinamide-GDP ribazoletransferase